MNDRRRTLVSVLVCALLLASGRSGASIARADLQADFKAALAVPALAKAKVGLYVADADTGQELVAINADETFMPASNLKLVTTAAALYTLGADFNFKTELRLTTAPGADGKGAVLLVKGDGDPGFLDAKLLAGSKLDAEKILALWVKAVQDAGVKSVDKIILDDRTFDYEMIHPTWPKGQLDSWYCAQVSGLSFNDNCADIFVRPNGRTGTTNVEVQLANPGITIINKASAGKGGQLGITRKDKTNDITITGSVSGNPDHGESITIHDPAALFGSVLKARLEAAGLNVGTLARPAADDKLPEGKTLHVVQTTLPAIMARCNKDSQNLFAECLLKRTGFAATGKPGSWESGAAAAHKVLMDKAKIADGSLSMVDGSGLSRDNRVSPKAIGQILTALHGDAKLGPVYLESLSIGHKDGTLEKRFDASLAGRVFGKSGFISGVSCLSGYVVVPQGNGKQRVAAFSFLFNKAEVGPAKELQDELVKKIDRALTK